MKKSVLLLVLSLMLGVSAFANDYAYVITDLNMENFWQKIGKPQEKVSIVAQNLILKNKINIRVPVVVVQNKSANATSNKLTRIIEVYSGLLPLIDNDDELAYILGHEIAHSVVSNQSPVKALFVNSWNSKTYEYKSDLKAIDYMVQAGYDPISAIVMGNKFLDEPLWDWGFLSTHPKGSKRLLEMYKYIYKKYPQYLNSPKTQSAYFKNFEYIFEGELKAFRHKEIIRQQKQQAREAI